MKKRLIRIIIGAVFFAAAIFVPEKPELLKLVVFLAAYAII